MRIFLLLLAAAAVTGLATPVAAASPAAPGCGTALVLGPDDASWELELPCAPAPPGEPDLVRRE